MTAAVHLRLSSRDRRAPMGRPVVLVDDSNHIVGAFRSHADGCRAQVLIRLVSQYQPTMDASTLHVIAGDVSQRLYGTSEYYSSSWTLTKFNGLISALRTELRGRR